MNKAIFTGSDSVPEFELDQAGHKAPNNFHNSWMLKSRYLQLLTIRSIILLAFGVILNTISVAENTTAIIGKPDIESTLDGMTGGNDLWNNHNLIKNWNFTIDCTNWGGWWDGATQIPPVVQDGIAVMKTDVNADGYNYHYQFNQSGLKAEANVPYTLKFKSWSSKARSNGLDFEDSPQNNYNRYGASTDPESTLGRSEWVYYTTPEPKWFTFHVVFDQMNPTTQQKIQWNLSTANTITYLDSILLYKDDTSSVNLTNLSLSETSLRFENTEANAPVNIASNTDWEIRCSQSWLIVTPPNGTGNQTFTVSAKANSMFAPRTATITVFATRLDPQTITVTQNAKPPLPIDSVVVEHWDSDAWNNYNLIKNWDFTTDLTNWGGWWDGATQIPPVVQDGLVVMQTDINADGNSWHYQFNQYGLKAEANVPYSLKFKSWSSKARSNGLDFEDGPSNNYNRYGASTDTESTLGRSEWVYYTTPEPKWFTFHVVFDQMVPNTEQKIQWALSNADATVYLDSVILIKDADLILINDANLVLSSTQLSIAAKEANTTVNITSNTKCMAISDQSWLTVDPANSMGNQTITISAKANLLTEDRTATVTVFAAGMESQTITVKQESITGIDPILNEQKMAIYPNPNSGKLKIVLNQNPPTGTYLIVNDLNGRTILKRVIQNKEEWINLNGNPQGVYLIKTNLKNFKVHKVILK